MFRMFLGAVAMVMLAAPIGRADIVYLNDGTVLYGKVLRQKETVNDAASGLSFQVPTAGGFFAVSDGTRVIIFSSKNLDPARPADDTNTRRDNLVLERLYPRPGQILPPAGEFGKPEPFNERGERTLTMRGPMGFQPVRQRLTFLSPFQLRLDAVDFNWTAHYLINELDKNLIRRLALQFDRLKEPTDKPDPDKRMLMYRFFVQAKWYDMAEKELDKLLTDVPSASERVEKARTDLKQLQAEQMLEEANISLNAGQLMLAQGFLQRIPKEGLDAALQVRITTTRVKIENMVKQWGQAQKYLRSLPDVAEGDCAEALCDAAAAIRDELYLDGLDRLEPFLNLAEQAERSAKSGREPAQRPEQLLALAVTGWLLGKESAETKPESARKIWKARRFAVDSMSTPSMRLRQNLVSRYKSDEPVDMAELARIIGLLPPPEPAPIISEEPLKRLTHTAQSGRLGIEYWVHTPFEYRHGRPCPLLLVLHHRSERPEQAMMRYAWFARRYGYILASVDWAEGIDKPYEYTTDEHQRVLDVLRDVRQHYNVDTDRVFLSGWGEGGNAAWDIGVSHPDLFAGVAPISCQPRVGMMMAYAPNARNLPFYVVTGDLAGDAPKHNHRLVQEWISKGFPALHIFYRGRGVEWFAAEMPYLFDWFGRKTRARAVPDLGAPSYNGADSYQVMRVGDQQRFWVSADGVDSRHLYENKRAGSNVVPARVQASIKPGNIIKLNTVGIKQASVLLGPGMVDFTRPVIIETTGLGSPKKWSSKQPLEPDLELMIEELYERGDTKRLVFNRIRLTP